MYITPVHAMGIAIIFLTLSPVKAYTQKDSLYLSVDQLFEKGIKQNLQLAANKLQERMAEERARTARMNRLPDIEIGLKTEDLWDNLSSSNGDFPIRHIPTHRTGRKTMQ